VFRCGSGTHLDVTKSSTGTAEQQTKAAWQVSDIRAEGRLRAWGVMPLGTPVAATSRSPCAKTWARVLSAVSAIVRLLFDTG
jgi:hypothetical protein